VIITMRESATLLPGTAARLDIVNSVSGRPSR
jgi:hypothetical protein